MHKYTPDYLISLLREAVADYGDVSIHRFCRLYRMSTPTIYLHFDSWRELREAAGLSPRKFPDPLPRSTADAIRAALRELVSEHGPNISLAEFCRRCGFSRNVIFDRFGTWRRLRELEGLSAYSRPGKRVSTEELLDDLIRLRDLLKRFPTHHEIERLGKHSIGTYYKRFGRQSAIRRHDKRHRVKALLESRLGPDWESKLDAACEAEARSQESGVRSQESGQRRP